MSKEIGFSCRISTGFSDTELCLSFANKQVSVTDAQSHHQLLLWLLLMAQVRRAKEIRANSPLAVGNSMGSLRTGLEGPSTDPSHSLMQDQLGLSPCQMLLQLVLKNFPCWNFHSFPRQAGPDFCPKLIRKLSSQLTLVFP